MSNSQEVKDSAHPRFKIPTLLKRSQLYTWMEEWYKTLGALSLGTGHCLFPRTLYSFTKYVVLLTHLLDGLVGDVFKGWLRRAIKENRVPLQILQWSGLHIVPQAGFGMQLGRLFATQQESQMSV